MHNTEGAARAGAQMMGHTMSPVAGGVIATTGYLAGRGLLGGVFANPVVMFAAGLAAGYFLHKYEKEIVLAVTKATGAGKDFILQQKESLEDLIEEARESEEKQAKGD
jgi:hypothetical protein